MFSPDKVRPAPERFGRRAADKDNATAQDAGAEYLLPDLEHQQGVPRHAITKEVTGVDQHVTPIDHRPIRINAAAASRLSGHGHELAMRVEVPQHLAGTGSIGAQVPVESTCEHHARNRRHRRRQTGVAGRLVGLGADLRRGSEPEGLTVGGVQGEQSRLARSREAACKHRVGVGGKHHAGVGRITSLVFLLGMIAILFAPDTSRRNMAE